MLPPPLIERETTSVPALRILIAMCAAAALAPAAVAQAGLPGYEITTWYGLVAPAGTPKAVVVRLNREVVRIMGLPDVQQRFAADVVEAAVTTPEQFGEFIRAEIRKWAKLVQDAGIRAE